MDSKTRSELWEEYKNHCLIASSIVSCVDVPTEKEMLILDKHRKAANDIDSTVTQFGLSQKLTSHVRKGMSAYAKVAYKYSETRHDEYLKRLKDIDEEMKGILN